MWWPERLPFGLYTVTVSHAGFSSPSQLVEIRSAFPKELKVTLSIGPVETTVNVTSEQTLIDPYATSSAHEIGGDTLTDRLSAQPGRGLADLINQEPGWMFEANGILHPRAEEYQVQYVIDGMPLTENRSAAYVADFDADNVQEMSEMVAGFPAEYGRKLGGVIEVQTTRDKRPGFHGKSRICRRHLRHPERFAEGQYGFGANTLTMSCPAPKQITSSIPRPLRITPITAPPPTSWLHYERDIDDKNRIGVIIGRESVQIPGAQRSRRSSKRDSGRIAKASRVRRAALLPAHLLSQCARQFPRHDPRYHRRLLVQPLATPMIACQDRGYHEQYVKGHISVHAGIHELKVWRRSRFRAESRGAQLPDHRSHTIRPRHAPRLHLLWPRSRSRAVRLRPGRDSIGKTSPLSAGLRFDHYVLLVRQMRGEPARRPRIFLAVKLKINFHASYDRVFQTPPFENLPGVQLPAGHHAQIRWSSGSPCSPRTPTTMKPASAAPSFGHLKLHRQLLLACGITITRMTTCS